MSLVCRKCFQLAIERAMFALSALADCDHDPAVRALWREQPDDAPEKCEGCNEPATTSDVQDVPLCAACMKELRETGGKLI